MDDCADHFDPGDKAGCTAVCGDVDCGAATRGIGSGTVTIVDKAFGTCVMVT